METEPIATTPKRKRRWFQFSLRALFVFVLACAVISALVANKMARKRIERDSLDRLVKLGGHVYFAYAREEASGPIWLRELLGDNFFDDVSYVDLKGANINDDDLLTLKALTEVEALRLVGTNVTDAGLTNLKCMPNLKVLNLIGTKVTDAGVKELQTALPHCDIIYR